MTFYIFRDKGRTILSDGELQITCTDEADAIDTAVRMAQDAEALYRINYYRP